MRKVTQVNAHSFIFFYVNCIIFNFVYTDQNLRDEPGPLFGHLALARGTRRWRGALSVRQRAGKHVLCKNYCSGSGYSFSKFCTLKITHFLNFRRTILWKNLIFSKFRFFWQYNIFLKEIHFFQKSIIKKWKFLSQITIMY